MRIKRIVRALPAGVVTCAAVVAILCGGSYGAGAAAYIGQLMFYRVVLWVFGNGLSRCAIIGAVFYLVLLCVGVDVMFNGSPINEYLMVFSQIFN